MSQENLLSRQLIDSRSKFLLGWVTLVLIQSLIWFDWINLGAASLAIAGGVLGVIVFFRMNLLRAYPISTSMLLGFTTYYFLLPPIATLIEGKPLTNNLLHPILVFWHALICLLSLATAHVSYRAMPGLQIFRRIISERLYRPFGFFNAPGNLHLLAMGSVGLLAMATQFFLVGSVQGEVLGAGNKFTQALFPLAYLPYCLLVRPIMGGPRSITGKWFWILVGYSVLLLLLSVSQNSRSVFFLGIASVALAHAYGLATGVFATRMLKARNVIIGIVGTLLIVGPLTDLSLSMVVVRAQRTDITPMQLISETLTTFLDKETLRDYRKLAALALNDWDETYVDNLFLSRLANLKYADQGMDLSMSLDESSISMLRNLEWQKTLSVLPRPALEILGLDVDKDLVSSASGGDLLLYAATGSLNALGGSRTGSLFGSGYGMFGWLYPLILALIAVVTFCFADAQTSRKSLGFNDALRQWTPVFSPMVIIAFFSWFFYLTSAATGIESMAGLIQLIIRGWLQILLIYAIAYWSTYLLLTFFYKTRLRLRGY